MAYDENGMWVPPPTPEYKGPSLRSILTVAAVGVLWTYIVDRWMPAVRNWGCLAQGILTAVVGFTAVFAGIRLFLAGVDLFIWAMNHLNALIPG